ncbi:MAG: hypothetical protein MR924_11080 [Prevotella sp.]|nr:hypothetical protein [Prevotella sp.]
MTITFKEFKNNVKANAKVFLGTFRFDVADDRYGREVSVVRFGNKEQYNCWKASAFFSLPLADSYKMDVYTDYDTGWSYTHYVKEESEVDFNSKRFYIVAPAFAKDVEKAYNRVNDAKRCCINTQVLAGVSESCATWMRRSDYLKGKNKVELLSGYIFVDACEKDEQKRDKVVRRTIGFAEKAFAKFLTKEAFPNENEYLAHVEWEDKKKAEYKQACARTKKAAEKKRVRDTDYVNSHTFDETGKPVVSGAIDFITRNINTGEHVMYRTYSVGKENSLTCEEKKDYNGYSRRFQFPMINRDFHLTVKNGYSIRIVGGLITFYRGEYKREGMACEWVEQGRAIADIVTKKGYLVRGEHIEAKTLKEAKRINAEKRKQQAIALLKSRAKRARKAEDEKRRLEELEEYMFTFEDSLNAGNCHPGTQHFKDMVEMEVGHEVNEISLADLRKYGKKFNLSYYTERVINYVMNRK